MNMDITHTHTIWESDKFEMPLRIKDDEGNISELRNIDTRKPAARLFRPLTG